MKRTALYLFAALMLLVQTPQAMAQNRPVKKKVTFTVEEMATQLKDYLNSATKVEEKIEANNKVAGQFADIYNTLDAKRKQKTVDLYNAARTTKMEPMPDYLNLTQAYITYSQNKVSATLFDEWMAAFTALPEKTQKTKEIIGFIDYSVQLLADRTLYASRTSQWHAQAGTKFSFAVGKNDIKTVFDTPMELSYSSGTGNNADNNTLHNTVGEYYYLDNRWEGRGGRITWERTGLASSECYAELKRYTAITKFPKFEADSVSFVNTRYFPKPLLGTLEEALSTRTEPEKYNFPKFRSYQKDFHLKDVMPGVDFEGSFMMYGPRFVTNDEKNPASMVFYRGGKRFLVVSATEFTILPHMLTSERAAVTMYLGDDSLTNAGVLVRYTVKDQRVNLLNNTKRNYYSPYNDTYHQFDIYCESINWLIDKDEVEFRMVQQPGVQTFVTFESNRYYSERKGREVQGIDNVSPVVRMYQFMKKHDMKHDFGLVSFQKAIGMDEAQTKLMVHNLSKAGMVAFDEGTNMIHVHDKLIGFYKAISKEKGHDYDALTLESNAQSVNAVLDLSTLDLNVHGIEKFVVSDSQLVVVHPYSGDITVKRNRDILFSGHINVGRFEMNVTNAYFSYDDFRFDLPQIDSLRFYVTDFKRRDKLHMVRTPLYSLVGDIQIDLPDNHCGLKKNPDYPIFNSRQPSYVYYDRPFILGGVYDRSRFYYSLNPFVLKQLTDFQTDSLEFGGTLTSAGIFPDIVEPLKVMRDYSLGFIKGTPKGGLPAYGGKGTYTDTVALSYGGLRGKGKLDYLTSTVKTDKYIFMPDSMVAQSDTFFVRPEQDFPDIQNSSTIVRWYPYRDSMTVSQLKDGPLFTMYQKQTLLAGRVTLQPKGAAATGTASLHDGTLRSPWFTLHTTTMDANVTSFSLRSAKYDNIAFQANNMRSHIDYEAHTGQFNANDSLSRTLLPALGYAAWIDQYTWDWESFFLALDNSHSMETDGMGALPLRERAKRMDKMPGAHFESTDPKLHGIKFSAIGSEYLYNELELTNRNVFALPIADVLIAPPADTLHISQGGNMSMMKGAQLLASVENGNHLFYDCDIIVEHGKKYSGKGVIDYVALDDSRQPITVTSIAPDAQGHTVAQGVVPDEAHFVLSPAFGFAGDVRIEAERKDYYFSGGVRLLHECTPIDQLGLLSYADYLDPDNIRVVVPQTPVDWKGNRINAGIRLDGENLKPTAAFLTKQQPGVELLASYGLLYYDNNAGTYTITSQRKLDDDDVVDRYVTLHTDDCTIDGEGPITFGLTEGPASIYAYGKAHLDPKDDKNFSLQTVFGVKFPIDDGVLKQMAQQIQDDLRPSPANADNDLLRSSLMFAMGEEDGLSTYQDYLITGAFPKLTGNLDNTLLFENVKWEYSPLKGYTANCVTGLSHVGKKQLHVNVRLKAQFYRKGTSEHLVLYIQVAGDHWYYFHYDLRAQSLKIASNVGEWNDRILAINKDKRKIDGFSYSVANSRVEIQNFLSWFSGNGAPVPDADDDEEEEE